MEYLPVNLDLNQQHCLVVGGGDIALRKTKSLLTVGAKVTVVSPQIHPDLVELANTGELVVFNGPYQADFLNNQRLVIAATDLQQVNLQVYQDAMKLNLLINVVDQPKLCNFIMSSIVNRGPLTVAISSSGTAPVLARMLREKFEWMLPQKLTQQLLKVKELRPKIAQRIPDFGERRSFWESYFEGILGWSVSENLMQQEPIDLSEAEVDIEELVRKSSSHKIVISCIDLGDGRPENLIAGSLQKLHKAEAIYSIGNIPENVLSLCRKDADLLKVENEIFEKQKIQQQNFYDLIKNLTQKNQVCLLSMGNSFEKNWPQITSIKLKNQHAFSIYLNRALRC